ncbi:methyltransferase domain-containing protein [Embleya sp. NBC_00888]|uniref:class I SAM-dependent methyltransferase n=1 Tax=Embleya sp. NBC_00888 TaxID=2975960 RepID=UPI00386BB781|nr:methyltransferase domain-containing protein [Embleya sp. NBC_00888]
MNNFVSNSYGEKSSEYYDKAHAGFDPYPGQIEFLRDKAGAGVAIEVGVGTGRIALPLARHGVPVIGIDNSPRMIELLRAKIGDLPVTGIIGDASICETVPGKPPTLIFGIFNFFYILPGRDAQLNFLKIVREKLAPFGSLVLEAFVPKVETILPDGPNPGFFPKDRAVTVKTLDADHIILAVSQNYPERSVWEYQEVVLRSGSPVEIVPATLHYLRPEEFDALAGEAGLKLAERYSGWDRSPFDESSPKHVSVYTVH